MQAHRAQLHILLAVYSMSMNSSEAAELQFNAALRVRIASYIFLFSFMYLFM